MNNEEFCKATSNSIFFPIFISGCYNAPIPPSEIEGAHISGLHYAKYDCESIDDEIKFLEKREKELLITHEERIKESEQQGWATDGIGLGDGIVASELNDVGGKKKLRVKYLKTKGVQQQNEILLADTLRRIK